MRLVIQRVSSASVTVEGKIVGKIGKGLFVLLGVAEGDTETVVKTLAEKLLKLRIMADENDKMNLSITDVKGEILVVSQFTLHADTTKGNRPSFIKAASPKLAERLYNEFIRFIKSSGVKVATGKFGEYMKIETELDGPVTITLNTE